MFVCLRIKQTFRRILTKKYKGGSWVSSIREGVFYSFVWKENLLFFRKNCILYSKKQNNKKRFLPGFYCLKVFLLTIDTRYLESQVFLFSRICSIRTFEIFYRLKKKYIKYIYNPINPRHLFEVFFTFWMSQRRL